MLWSFSLLLSFTLSSGKKYLKITPPTFRALPGQPMKLIFLEGWQNTNYVVTPSFPQKLKCMYVYYFNCGLASWPYPLTMAWPQACSPERTQHRSFRHDLSRDKDW